MNDDLTVEVGGLRWGIHEKTPYHPDFKIPQNETPPKCTCGKKELHWYFDRAHTFPETHVGLSPSEKEYRTCPARPGGTRPRSDWMGEEPTWHPWNGKRFTDLGSRRVRIPPEWKHQPRPIPR